MKLSVYQAAGFYCLSNVAPGGLVTKPMAAVSIVKGDYLIDDTNGYVTNTATDTSAAFVGIANESVNNSAGASGDLNIEIIPFDSHLIFSVPVGNSALITRTAIGTLCDLAAAGTLDIADTTIATGTIAFFIDDMDASAAAILGNAYGYAIGHFRMGAP